MDLLVIAGFLGSGKTSLLLHAARRFLAQQRRVVVIENEIGKTGVDDQTLAAQGLDVRAILSGCICCSLRQDLINTLLDLERTVAPEVVIVEPSGVAGPHLVQQALQGYGGELGGRHLVVLVDSPRLARISDLSPPFIQRSLEVADQILLNKVDLVTGAVLDDLTRRLQAVRPQATIAPLSITQGLHLGEALDRIEAGLRNRTTFTPSEPAPDPEPKGPPGAIAVSSVRTLSLVVRQPEPRLAILVESLAATLRPLGCHLIGHIKAAVTGPGGCLTASVTDFDRPADQRGAWIAPTTANVRVTLNAIVFGVSRQQVCEVVETALDRFAILGSAIAGEDQTAL